MELESHKDHKYWAKNIFFPVAISHLPPHPPPPLPPVALETRGHDASPRVTAL